MNVAHSARGSALRLSLPTNASRGTKRTVCTRCLNAHQLRTTHAFQRSRPLAYRAAHARVSFPSAYNGRTIPKTPLRGLATVSSDDPSTGPLAEYERRVAQGRLKDDDHQRGVIKHLQTLHETLKGYNPAPVEHPTIESLQPRKKSILGSLFSSSSKAHKTQIPPDLPKGLYMYGDVGSGKTMMMDLFHDTLPPNITSKSRIHFNNFMQDVHKRLHLMKMKYGNDVDAVPFVAADLAEQGRVFCFDEFQCTDVADAMILRRLLEALMSHGVVLVTTSNRHPDELYKNGVQRESFIPCITLLKTQLEVINLDSPTDYRKVPRPPSGVYHFPLDGNAQVHADRWFNFLGDLQNDPPHPATHRIWGRNLHVPRVSGNAAVFTFDELIRQPKSAADYLELMRRYQAFIVTDVPGMTHRERDLARRFITFIDTVYESRAKLVLTTAVPLTHLFLSKEELADALRQQQQHEGVNTSPSPSSPSPSSPFSSSSSSSSSSATKPQDVNNDTDTDTDDTSAMMHLLDDLGTSHNMDVLQNSHLFTGDEERFAFARALSRLTEMGSKDWVERDLSSPAKDADLAFSDQGKAHLGGGAKPDDDDKIKKKVGPSGGGAEDMHTREDWSGEAENDNGRAEALKQ
ncbi:hypothetical protein L228DRAFT_265956 [Xylona heveae TC161]|uniref:AFG1-like ATPase n=1 Tax=Xylona heveae (strain CBS 132557 / TC161) TaxID=1328760 RepID=A0A165IWW3_XYLHT|nr:hypothetical protein L228DRAFT_265956 [Xylona heveae TC161]KZF25488.1 hypothetical protein L228DRAFT_265956 [Xylona heveae TC161]